MLGSQLTVLCQFGMERSHELFPPGARTIIVESAGVQHRWVAITELPFVKTFQLILQLRQFILEMQKRIVAKLSKFPVD